MNLQSIDRLQSLLARVEANAKRPRTRTQGFGMYRAFQAQTPAAAPVVAVPVSPQAPAIARPAPESVPPESLPVEELLDIDISVSEPPPPVASATVEGATLQDLAARNLESDELPIEDVSAEELGAEEISVEIASEVMLDAPESSQRPAAIIAASVVPKTYTAPPSLDELTFSEPPPALPSLPSAKEALIEPPPSSTAQPISETPGSIDAAIRAATHAQAESADTEIPAVTPPPESGPQVAMPAMPAPHVPAVTGAYRATAPTVEQLGDVVELEPPSVIPLELAERRVAEARKVTEQVAPASEELEFVPQVSEPSRRSSARDPQPTLVEGFAEETGSEPSTGVDRPSFERPRVAGGHERSAVAPATTAARAADFQDEAPTASSPLAPEAVARPISVRQPAILDVVSAARGYRPRSFAELLDASIGLLK